MLYKKLSAPTTCQVEITTACNNSCIYCYNHWRSSKEIKNIFMSKETMNLVIDEIIKNKIFSITLTGGEVLLNKSVLIHAVKRLISSGIQCTVNSNLINMTQELAEELFDSGLREILTSVCSYEESLHDQISQREKAFSKTIKGISYAQLSGINVASSMVVTKLNVNNIIETGLFLKDKGIKYFYATKASPPVNSINFKQYLLSKKELIGVLDDLNLLKKNHGLNVGILECYPLCGYLDAEKYPFATERRCAAGVTTIVIGADGNIRACIHSDEIFGNIKDGIKRAWSSMNPWRDGSKLSKECISCEHVIQCSGGCRIDSKYVNGIDSAMDPYANYDNVSKIKEKIENLEQVDEFRKLKVVDIKVRKERLGYLCADAKKINSPVFLTNDTYQLITFFKGVEFTASDVSLVFKINIDQAKEICSLLIKDSIFVII